MRGESSVCHCHLELESLSRERINSSITLMVMDLPLMVVGVGSGWESGSILRELFTKGTSEPGTVVGRFSLDSQCSKRRKQSGPCPAAWLASPLK